MDAHGYSAKKEPSAGVRGESGKKKLKNSCKRTQAIGLVPSREDMAQKEPTRDRCAIRSLSSEGRPAQTRNEKSKREVVSKLPAGNRKIEDPLPRPHVASQNTVYDCGNRREGNDRRRTRPPHELQVSGGNYKLFSGSHAVAICREGKRRANWMRQQTRKNHIKDSVRDSCARVISRLKNSTPTS